MDKVQPVKKFRQGQISVSVWVNESPEFGKYYSTSMERRYSTKEEGEWKSTNSLRTQDLPVAAELLRLAFAWVKGVEE